MDNRLEILALRLRKWRNINDRDLKYLATQLIAMNERFMEHYCPVWDCPPPPMRCDGCWEQHIKRIKKEMEWFKK